MKIILLFILISLTTYQFLLSKDINQINDEPKPHYLISVTQDGTILGDIEIETFPDIAPKHCHNLDSLVAIEFYDGTAFHRVIPNFMIQGGDPNSKDKPKNTWDYGDPSQTTVPAEFSSLKHLRGTLSAARANDPNSATSQFFICVVPCPWLDNQYSIYGQVVNGMETVDKIVNTPRDGNDNPINKVEMKIKKIDATDVTDNLFNNREIKIFPNPSNELIKFTPNSENITVNKISIYDINGNVYIANNYNNTNLSDITIPTNNLLVGVYYVKILSSNNKEYVLRFILN